MYAIVKDEDIRKDTGKVPNQMAKPKAQTQQKLKLKHALEQISHDEYVSKRI